MFNHSEACNSISKNVWSVTNATEQGKNNKAYVKVADLTHGLASDEWVSSETSRTATDRVVVHYFAASSHTTGAWTGVSTSLVAARLILTTLRAHYTFRPACRRAAYEAGYARTYGLPVNFAALTVGSAWRRTARQRHHRRYTAHRKIRYTQSKKARWHYLSTQPNCRLISKSANATANRQKAKRFRIYWHLHPSTHTYANALLTRYWSALHKWISRCALWATAYRYVVYNVACAPLATRSRARIGAFVSDTSPVSRTVHTQYTFRATTGIRVPLVFRQASASSIPTLSVWATRRRVAWIGLYRFCS